jgi:hypothetical protein
MVSAASRRWSKMLLADVAHDEAVEQRHPAIGAGAGQDPACGQKPEILQSLLECQLPTRIPDLVGDGRDPPDRRPDHHIGIHIHNITIVLALQREGLCDFLLCRSPHPMRKYDVGRSSMTPAPGQAESI